MAILFFALVYGIHIKELNTPYVNLKELYIKWNEKLIITADEALILANSSDTRKKPFEIKTTLAILTEFSPLFEKIDIRYIRYKDIRASILYAEDQDGYVTLDTKFMHLDGTIHIDSNTIDIQVGHLNFKPLQIKSSGSILFDKSNKLLRADMNVAMADEAFFRLKMNFNNGIVHYKADFEKSINDYKKILALLELPKGIRYWSMDAIKLSGLTIQKLEGFVDIKNLKDAYRHVEVAAKAHELSYTYNKELAPIQTLYTYLEYKGGVLYIRPKHPKTYDFDLQKSHLKIDFTKKEELLTLYLKFNDGFLDKNMLHILATYGINVPLRQNSGKIITDLTLRVGLRNLNVSAKGTFRVKKGNFHYLGMDIDVENLLVKLHNSHVVVNRMFASYKNMIRTYVDIDLKLAKHTGLIAFDVQNITLKEYDTLLASPVRILYHINKKGLDTIEIPQTKWLYAKKNTVLVEAMRIPFEFKTLQLQLPVTKVQFNQTDTLLLSGVVGLKELNADLDVDLIKMEHEHFKMAQSNIYLHVSINKSSVNINSTKRSYVYIGSTEFYLDRFELALHKGILSAKEFVLGIRKRFNTNMDFEYDLKERKGTLLLKYAKLFDKSGMTFYETDKPIKLKVYTKNGLHIYGKQIGMAFGIDTKGNAKVQLASLKKLLPYSPVLQKFKVQDGRLELDDKLHLKGELTSEYALFVDKKNTPVNKYKIEADITASKTTMTINKKVHLFIAENIDLKANGVGFNVAGLEKLSDDLQKEQKKKKKSSKNLYATITKSYFYINKTRRIIFDKLEVQSVGKETTAQLTHKKGHAGFRYLNDKFYLYGSKFNDEFMDNLFFQSKFKGGELSFNIVGTPKKYKGIVEIENTTILDYKILNNILAFIDTIPSLMTFSLPKYSSEGLAVHKAYASFTYKKHIFDFDNIYLHSDQIDIVGKGKASYKEDFIDLTLQLKTNLANKASQIPVVGYILFDGKTISTTLKVKGKLEDPKVETMIAKDIAVAPLNIVKRTLLYPLHLFGLDKSSESNETEK